MKVELTPRVAALLAERMASGHFESESEAIAAGLLAWSREEWILDDVDWDHVNRLIAEVDASPASGRTVPAEVVHQRVRDLIRAKAAVAAQKK